MLEQLAKWSMVVLLAGSAFTTVDAVDKPRRPLDRTTAAVVVVVTIIWISAIVAWWD